MTRRLAALVACSLFLGGCRQASRPNLVVVVLDTTRADRLGAYGWPHAKTPNIDGIARDGFLFRRHLTPVPITLPAHTTLFTGLHPPMHTVRDNGTFVVPPDQVTLAEVLKPAGYETSAFVGAFPVAARFGLGQGFDHYDDRLTAGDQDQLRQRLDIFFDERPAAAVVDAAIAHHRDRPSRRPFFTFLHFFDPHQPLRAPAPFDVEFRERPYDGEIAYVDQQLGRFFQLLRERGEWDDTVVVVTADHGEGLGEHGELTHSMLLHQATLHIPLLLRGPGVPQGETRGWSDATQVFDTLLDLLEVPRPPLEQPRGRSLLGRMRGGTSPEQFTSYFETIAPRSAQGWSQLVGLMEGDWRYVHAPRPELYDLAHDPAEARNLAPYEAERAARMRQALATFLERNQVRTVGDSFLHPDPEVADKLAALGYVQAQGGALQDMDDLMQVDGRLDPKDRVADVSTISDAKAAMALRRWDKAEILWLRVVERTPGNTYALQGLAQLYGLTGQWSKCLAWLGRAIVQAPRAANLRRMRGAILVQLGRPADGIEDLKLVADDSVESLTWMGAAHRALGRSAEAAACFKRGLEKDPRNRWLRLYQANLLAGDGASAEAERLFRELVADEPYFALGLYNYGVLMTQQGRAAAARPLFERAARLAPHHEPTLAALARQEAAPTAVPGRP